MKALPLVTSIIIASLIINNSCTTQKNQPKRTKIALAGSYCDSIYIIDKLTKQIEWSYPLPRWDSECNSIEVNEDGTVLFSYRRGARLVTRDKQVVWDIQRLSQNEEIHTAKRNDNGDGYIIASSGNPAIICETDRFGNRTKIIKFDTKIEDIHSQFRQIVKSINGNYLIPIISKAEILEIDTTGTIVNKIPLESSAYSLQELPDGSILVPHKTKIIIYNQKGDKIKSLYPPKTIDYLTQAKLKDNGNIILTNWQGYSQNGNWQIMELDSLNNVIWEFNDVNRIKYISAFYEFEE